MTFGKTVAEHCQTIKELSMLLLQADDKIDEKQKELISDYVDSLEDSGAELATYDGMDEEIVRLNEENELLKEMLGKYLSRDDKIYIRIRYGIDIW